MEEKDVKQEKENNKNDNKKEEKNNNNDKNEIKESLPSKEISDFLSIINQTIDSLPNFLNSIQKYFSSLENKITNLIQQIENLFNINFNYEIININKDEQLDINNIKDDIFAGVEQNAQLYKYIDIFNKYQKFLYDNNKELSNTIKDTIINEIKKQLNKFKIDKHRLLNKFRGLIKDVSKLKKNIDLIENKNNEDLKIDNSNELRILQDYIIQFEKEYNTIISTIKNLNENIIAFIWDNLNKYFETTSKIQEEINKERIKILNNLKKIKTNEDSFFCKVIQKNNENLFKNIKKFNSLKIEDETKEKKKTLLSRLGDVIMADTEYFMIMNHFEDEIETSIRDKKEDDNYNKEDLSFLKKLITKLKKPEVVSDDSLSNCFTILGNNSNRKYYINLCFNFVKYVNSNSVSNKENNNYNNFKYYNFDNFIFSNNLFNMISHNCQKNNISSTDKKEEFKENYKYYQILDNIINIGEQSFIDDKYMCSLLKDNEFISEIKTWESCFKCELITSIKRHLNRKDKNINLIQNIINLFRNKTIISSYQNYDFIKNLGLDQYINNYDKLKNNYINNFNNYDLPKIVHNSIKKYIFHMVNFNIDYINVLNFIKQINEDFPFIKDEYWSFYLNYYKSSLNSIKKQKFQSKITNIKIKRRIKYIKQNKKNKDLDGINNPINDIQYNNHKKLILIFKKSIIFLTDEEKRKLLCLNKNINMSKYIYKILLEQKELSLEKHIKIWKVILGCSKMKDINYTELCKNNEHVEYYKVIIDDTKRTKLKNLDSEKSEKITKNILCCFALKNTSKIKYCQGMNFLTAFLYDITNNEEDAFLLLTCLIDNTQLSKIYDQHFELLNCYFYILDRLIFLFLPQITKKLNESHLNIDCFVSPYFLTLFSHVYNLSYNSNKFMFFIIDNFIMKGWRVIFKSILSLLKYNEKEFLEKKDDDAANYIVHDIKKSDIFLDDKFETFLDIYNSFYIKNELIDNLKEEYYLENKIKKELNINVDQ